MFVVHRDRDRGRDRECCGDNVVGVKNLEKCFVDEEMYRTSKIYLARRENSRTEGKASGDVLSSSFPSSTIHRRNECQSEFEGLMYF